MPIRSVETAAPANDPAPIGHNSAPVEDDVRAQFKDQLLDARPDFLLKVEQIEGAADRVTVTDEDTLGRAGDLVKMCRAAMKHVADTHKEVKAPYLAAGRTVDAEKNALTDRLEAAKRKAERPMNIYVAERELARRQAEQARREAEEAARKAAAEAAESSNPAPTFEPEPEPEPENEPTRSDGGTTVSVREEWQSQVTDYCLAFMFVEDDEKVREAIDKAISRRVRAGVRKMDGVRIYSTTKTVSV